MASTPTQFANTGLDLLTQWQQVTERLIAYSAAFEARGGELQWNNAKHVAPQGGELTPQQVAENTELDKLRAAALDVVTHHNELVEWLTPPRRVRIATRRTDY